MHMPRPITWKGCGWSNTTCSYWTAYSKKTFGMFNKPLVINYLCEWHAKTWVGSKHHCRICQDFATRELEKVGTLGDQNEDSLLHPRRFFLGETRDLLGRHKVNPCQVSQHGLDAHVNSFRSITTSENDKEERSNHTLELINRGYPAQRIIYSCWSYLWFLLLLAAKLVALAHPPWMAWDGTRSTPEHPSLWKSSFRPDHSVLNVMDVQVV